MYTLSAISHPDANLKKTKKCFGLPHLLRESHNGTQFLAWNKLVHLLVWIRHHFVSCFTNITELRYWNAHFLNLNILLNKTLGCHESNTLVFASSIFAEQLHVQCSPDNSHKIFANCPHIEVNGEVYNKKVTVFSKWSFVTVYSKATVYKCKLAVYKCKCFSLTLSGYSHCVNEK